MVNIKLLLESKPNNAHYLNRYIKFIEYCERANLSLATDAYTENHHILPKAKDSFPEYKNIKDNPWNSIRLTSRQHIMAHVMLWKVYGKSQLSALYYMLNVQNYDTSYNDRKVPASIDIRYAGKIRNEYRKNSLGFATYKDSDGTKYYLHTSDPLIQELSLVGSRSGSKMSEESKEKMARAKDNSRKCTLYNLDRRKKVLINSDEYNLLLNSGWYLEKTQSDYAYIKIQSNKKTSEKLKGFTSCYYPDGTYYGKISKDDPAIAEFGLKYIPSEKNRAQYKERSRLAVERNTGSLIYNDGLEERKFKDTPVGSRWVLGRLARSVSHAMNFADAIKKANSDKTYWNNGLVCMKLPNGEHPGIGWISGMLPRKPNNIDMIAALD